MTTFHDLSAVERDALLGAATAPNTHGDGPNKKAVYERVCDLRDNEPSLQSIYTAINSLAERDIVHIAEYDGRTKVVTLTPEGVRQLDAAGERLTDAVYGRGTAL